MPAPFLDFSVPGSEAPRPVGGYRNAPVTAPGFDSASRDVHNGPPALSNCVLIDIDKLDKAANAANEAAVEADRVARWMDGVASRSGPVPWGDDPGLGQSFGSVFAEPRSALVQAVGTLPAVLRTLADQLQQTSSAFGVADDEAAALVQSLRSRTERTGDAAW